MKFLKSISLILLALFVTVAGCTEQEGYDEADSQNENGPTAITQTESGDQSQDKMEEDSNAALAVLTSTQGNKAEGTVIFKKMNDGVKVHANFSNLPQGAHGFHVHLYGDCSAADGTSAGTHFNFEGSSKNPPADIDRITGNLGNVSAGANGSATADTTISNTTISDIMGRAVIVHAKGNDPSQPPIGAAGARLGCGVIGHANPETMKMMDKEMMEEESMEESY